MYKGLVRKIFLTTTLLLLLFFVFQMVFQNIYIDTLYDNAKTNTFKSTLKDFVEEFKSSDQTPWSSNFLSSEFAKSNTAPIMILTEDHEILNTNYFREFNLLTINLGKGKVAHLIVDYLNDYPEFSFNSLNFGERLQVQGYSLGNSDFMVPTVIQFGHRSYTNFEAVKSNQEATPITYTGYVKEMQIISRDYEDFNHDSHVLYKELQPVLSQMHSMDDSFLSRQEKSIDQQWSNSDYRVLAEKTTLGGQAVYFFTLQRVEKIAFVFNTLNSYYLLMYGFCLLILIVISFFYSKWITRPLLHLNSVAKSIASLDFSKKATLSSKDELEELSNSLNAVSQNLEKTIADLKNSNVQLADEAAMRTDNENRIRCLLTNLSHEFKTPLSIISGFIDVLEDRVNDKKPEYYYGVIKDEIETLDHLITETIELSKLESGYHHLEYRTFQLEEVVDKVSIAFENKLSEKNLSLLRHTPVSTVHADRDRIEQVLINLLSNAIKYSEPNRDLNIRILPHNPESVLVQVENDGYLDEEALEHIWTRYYRIENNSPEGSGIGLEIVKNILDLHESTYGVRNHSGKIQFYFSLKTLPIDKNL